MKVETKEELLKTLEGYCVNGGHKQRNLRDAELYTLAYITVRDLVEGDQEVFEAFLKAYKRTSDGPITN